MRAIVAAAADAVRVQLGGGFATRHRKSRPGSHGNLGSIVRGLGSHIVWQKFLLPLFLVLCICRVLRCVQLVRQQHRLL